jgi:hypothetical protein
MFPVMQACEEWLVRLRLPQLRLAAAAGHHGAIIFHASQHLAHLHKLTVALLENKKKAAPVFAPAAPASVKAPKDAAPSPKKQPSTLPEKEWPLLAAPAVNPGNRGPDAEQLEHAAAGALNQARANSGQQGRQKGTPAARRRATSIVMPVPVQRIRRRSEEEGAKQQGQAGAPEASALLVRLPEATNAKGLRAPVQPATQQLSLHQRRQRLHGIAAEALSTLREAGLALVVLGDPDGLAGLHAHAAHAFRPVFAATKYASCHSLLNDRNFVGILWSSWHSKTALTYVVLTCESLRLTWS